MWTKDALQDLIQTRLGDRQLMLVSNREPYQHRYASGRIECVPPASGMVSALEPILRACGGVWVAHGSGSADRRTVDASDHIRVPPDDPRYSLRRVWLSKAQEEGYYNGLANGGLWPLCHMVFTRPEFNPRHWPVYRQVNEHFAEAVLQEAGSDPAFVFVQDFHFGLLPRMLKERNANLIVAHFWHIPWPSPEVFQTFPWKEELLEGLLGNDLLGFHLRYHCKNFLDTVDRTLEAKVDYERFEITRGGKVTVVRPFPISIDAEDHDETARELMPWSNDMERWRRQPWPVQRDKWSASASTTSTTPRACRNDCTHWIFSWKSIRNSANGWYWCRLGCRHAPTFISTRCWTTKSTAWSRRSTGGGAPTHGGRSFISSSCMGRCK